MPSKFHYRGTLEETSLSDMLATIYRHKVPGKIVISRDETVKEIYIHEGNVVHATSSDRQDSLGAYLYRQGKISREQLSATLKQRERSGKLYGQLLVEEGLLSPKELYGAIRAQMEAIVWSVFSWSNGEVTFQIGEFHDALRIKIHLPMRQLIVRGIRQVADTKTLVTRLGSKATVFKPRYEIEDLIELALDNDEYALLRLIDGERRFFDVCNEGPFGVPENARMIYAFRLLRLIAEADDDGGSGVKIRLGDAPVA